MMEEDQSESDGVGQIPALFRSSSIDPVFISSRNRIQKQQPPPSKLSKISIPIPISFRNKSFTSSTQVRPAQRNAYSAAVLEDQQRELEKAAGEISVGDNQIDEDQGGEEAGTRRNASRRSNHGGAAAARAGSIGGINRTNSGRPSEVNSSFSASQTSVIRLRPSLSAPGSTIIDAPSLRERCGVLAYYARCVTSAYAKVIRNEKTFDAKGKKGVDLGKLNQDWEELDSE